MRQFILWSSAFLFTLVILSCGSARKAKNSKSDQSVYKQGPMVVIYQTKQDYSKFVPVIMSNDKKSIESYPGIEDIYFDGNLAYPTQLHKGYWLDNRGISGNVVFLNLTFEEYSKLPKTPAPDELMKMISDSQPVLNMYSCGLRSAYKDIITELNSKIDADDFSTFTKIK